MVASVAMKLVLDVSMYDSCSTNGVLRFDTKD